MGLKTLQDGFDPQLELIEATCHTLYCAANRLGSTSLTARKTPEHEMAFFNIGQDFLMLGGNLYYYIGALIAPIDGLNPEKSELMEALSRMRELAANIGRDDQFLEGESVVKLRLLQEADIILIKLSLLDEFTRMLPEIVAIAKRSESENLNLDLFEYKIQALQEALDSQVSLLNKYLALRQNPEWKILSTALFVNLAVGIGGVTALQYAEKLSPGFGEMLRNFPVLGWLYSNVLTTLPYKIASAFAGIITNTTLLRWVSELDGVRDRTRFGITNESIDGDLPVGTSIET